MAEWGLFWGGVALIGAGMALVGFTAIRLSRRA